MKKINLGRNEIIHFVGIGGIGMSGLAQIMKNMGFQETACGNIGFDLGFKKC